MTPGCFFFTWITNGHPDPQYRSTCWLKTSQGTPVTCASCVSGPRMCGGDSGCCPTFRLDSTGMGDFYQGSRLGTYIRYGRGTESICPQPDVRAKLRT